MAPITVERALQKDAAFLMSLFPSPFDAYVTLDRFQADNLLRSPSLRLPVSVSPERERQTRAKMDGERLSTPLALIRNWQTKEQFTVIDRVTLAGQRKRRHGYVTKKFQAATRINRGDGESSTYVHDIFLGFASICRQDFFFNIAILFSPYIFVENTCTWKGNVSKLYNCSAYTSVKD